MNCDVCGKEIVGRVYKYYCYTTKEHSAKCTACNDAYEQRLEDTWKGVSREPRTRVEDNSGMHIGKAYNPDGSCRTTIWGK